MQIRDVPENVHRTLKSRAAASGVSLSEYVRTILAGAASRPTVEELEERIKQDGSASLGEPSEVAIRRLRDHGEE